MGPFITKPYSLLYGYLFLLMNASHSFVLANIPFQLLFSSILPNIQPSSRHLRNKSKIQAGLPTNIMLGLVEGRGKEKDQK